MESPASGGPPRPKLVGFGSGFEDKPLIPENGYITLPTTPGLGMDLDVDKLRAHGYQQFPNRNFRMPVDEP
jgi:hypothetical protein